ncbi:MAG: sigma-54-dependent transcriptional regulator [Parachlamydiaceae bacterium]
MTIQKILIVDDEKLVRDFLVETLKRKNFEVDSVDSGQKAFGAMRDKQYDLIITDLKMPDYSGIDVLRKAKELCPGSLVVIVTAYGSVENAVDAMKLGAFNYLIKPFSPDTIEAILEKANEHLSLVAENSYLRQQLNPQAQESKFPIVAESPAMKKIITQAERIASSNANVLITGESGTGKEVIASFIHFHSQRAKNPFIKVNCAAVPETLIESEFFGHEKGSFTGALSTHRGRFELANGGSLLLDEITEIPLGLQAKLLRVIQEQEFERIGGTRSIKIDVRIISTSNRNMQEALAQKVIREDLYFRLNVMPIHLPALRERKEDILPLAEFFLKKFSEDNHKEPARLSKESQKMLLEYNWPGNVREIGNIIERAVVLNTSGEITPDEIYLVNSFAPKEEASGFDKIELCTLQELEKKQILETLEKLKHNRTKTAQALGISIRTLRNKILEYNLKT